MLHRFAIHKKDAGSLTLRDVRKSIFETNNSYSTPVWENEKYFAIVDCYNRPSKIGTVEWVEIDL